MLVKFLKTELRHLRVVHGKRENSRRTRHLEDYNNGFSKKKKPQWMNLKADSQRKQNKDGEENIYRNHTHTKSLIFLQEKPSMNSKTITGTS